MDVSPIRSVYRHAKQREVLIQQLALSESTANSTCRLGSRVPAQTTDNE
jgi:hypothetical protein